MELNKIYNEDCLDGMKRIPDGSVDCIICDLPYGTTACKWDTIIPFEPLWEQYERIVKPKGNIVLFGNGLFAYKLALSNEKLYRYDLIWEKSKCGSPLTAKYMPLKKHEHILSKQILRSGTSIGANVRESYNAQSKADFINKLSIALKEANETLYWLELFLESEIITRDEYDSLFQDLDELIALLTSTIKTSKKIV